MNKVKWIVTFLMLFVVAACVPQFTYPLSKKGEQSLDKSLIGSWMNIDKKGELIDDEYLKITLEKNKQELHLELVGVKSPKNTKRPLKEKYFIGHTTIVKNKRYMNLRYYDSDEKKLSNYYFVVYYKITGKDLMLSPLKSEIIMKKIRGGVLKGRIWKRNGVIVVEEIYVEEKGEKLRNAIYSIDLKSDKIMKFKKR